MRTLNTQEMQQVAGGTLCLLPKLFAKLTSCLPKVSVPKCEPKPPVCQPEPPKCAPKPKHC